MSGKKGRSGRKSLLGESSVLGIRLPNDLLERIDEYAKKEYLLDRSSAIRKALSEHFYECLSKQS